MSPEPLDTGRDLAVEGYDLKNSFGPGIHGYGEWQRTCHGFITPWRQWECREGYQRLVWLNTNSKLYLSWIFTCMHIQQPWHSSDPMDFVILGFGIHRETLATFPFWIQGSCVTKSFPESSQARWFKIPILFPLKLFQLFTALIGSVLLISSLIILTGDFVPFVLMPESLYTLNTQFFVSFPCQWRFVVIWAMFYNKKEQKCLQWFRVKASWGLVEFL